MGLKSLSLLTRLHQRALSIHFTGNSQYSILVPSFFSIFAGSACSTIFRGMQVQAKVLVLQLALARQRQRGSGGSLFFMQVAGNDHNTTVPFSMLRGHQMLVQSHYKCPNISLPAVHPCCNKMSPIPSPQSPQSPKAACHTH